MKVTNKLTAIALSLFIIISFCGCSVTYDLGEASLPASGKISSKEETVSTEDETESVKEVSSENTQSKNPMVGTVNLMEKISAEKVDTKSADDTFIFAQRELAADIFKRSAKQEESKNLLISPLSVQLSLSMVANGASGTTKEEMEKVLGKGISLENLNGYLKAYSDFLAEQGNVSISNSMWVNSDLADFDLKKDFLQTDANYYGAAVYKTPFSKDASEKINSWVKSKTKGTVEKAVEKLDDNDYMCLINTLLFEAAWDRPYSKTDIKHGYFYGADGQQRDVPMLSSIENTYFETYSSAGIVKEYDGGKYRFVAVLPNEDLDIDDYIQSMTGDTITDIFSSVYYTEVDCRLPRFSYDYNINLSTVLKKAGMPTAFGKNADFTTAFEKNGDLIYLSKVIHKTHIDVSEEGAKAGAATVSYWSVKGITSQPDYKKITFNRPFVYIIVDSNNIPIFMGAAMNIGETAE